MDCTGARQLTQAASRVSITPVASRSAVAASGQLHNTIHTLEFFMPYLFLLLVLGYPVAEIFSIFWLAGEIGGFWTFCWLVAAFLLGALMLRHQKLAVMLALFGDLRNGALTPRALLRVARYYLAALFFMIPGPLSDVAAILLLLPWGGNAEPSKPVEDGVIEGEFHRVEPTQKDKFIP